MCINGTEMSRDEDGPGGWSFSQASTMAIPPTWVLLDNQSTVDLFCNGNLLVNIREVDSRMNVRCNAGSRITNMIGDLPGYGWVWYDPQAIANILSLKRVKQQYHVYYDSQNGGSFVVTKPDGEQFEFRESETGLYYLDTTSSASATVLVTTVEENKARYTNADYLRAVQARELQIKVGRPSPKQFIQIVAKNQLRNCPITRADIMAAEDIFGPDVGSLQGKTTRKRPHIVRTVVMPLPPTIMSRYRAVTLCVDLMYVNGIPMLVSISRNIRFCTVEAVPNRSGDTLVKGIKNIAAVYKRAGFKIVATLMDGEFEPLRGDLADAEIALNTTARDEHVGDIERFIRTLKERMRANYNTLPFTRIPTRLVIEMAKSCVFWLNSFPHPNGVSADLSPRTIITGQSIDFNRHCKYEFGQYVQSHEQHDNSMAPRTIGALATRPTGNEQGSFYFFSLSTGRVINRGNATPLPMPDDVIDRVHVLARRQKANPGLVFSDRNQAVDDEDDDGDDDDNNYDPDDEDEGGHGDDDYDDEYDDEDDGDDDDDYDPAEHDSNDDELDVDEDDEDAHIEDADVPGVNDDAEAPEVDGDEEEPGVNNAPVVVGTVDDDDNEDNDDDDGGDVDGNDDDDSDHVPSDDEGDAAGEDAQASIDEDMDERYGARSGAHGLRKRKVVDHSHLFTNVHLLETLVTPQMGMKKGLKVFGKEGVEAVRKEMQQLHDRTVMAAKKPKDLTAQQKKDALEYLMFLKRKRCGTVKGRGCADGRKQRAYISKADAASPTVATESVFLTAVIDAVEGREVAVVDVPGAFMQADMDELVHVRFTGKMTELLLEIDREMYEPCVVMERGEMVMYVELLKALYGTMRAAQLFWEKLSAKLQEWGLLPILTTRAW
jgi:hypothetical protein